LDYIHENPKKGSRFPPELQDEKLISSDSKSRRGFQNIETAYLLCPLRFKALFEENPQYVNAHIYVYSMVTFRCRAFLDKVKDGSIILTARDLPLFMYDQGNQYDEYDEVTGLFRGFLLVRVRRTVFKRPSSVTVSPTGLPSYFYWSVNCVEPYSQCIKVEGKNIQLESGHRQDHCLRMRAGKTLSGSSFSTV